MKNLNKITLTIDFWTCHESTKEIIYNSIMNDIELCDKDNLKEHTFNYKNWEEKIIYNVDFSIKK